MATRSHEQAQKIYADLVKAGVQKVKVAVTDVDGILRGKYIHIDKFKSALEKGFGFCNVVFGWDSSDVCYDKSTYTGWHSGYPDALAKLDLSTHRQVPWDDQVHFFLGDFYENDGEKALEICPRQVLRRVIDRLKKKGYQPMAGCEFEWFNFRETPESLAEKASSNPTPLSPGMFGYSILRSGLNQNYFNQLYDLLAAFRVPLEGLHTETGPGVYEAAIQVSHALEAADRAVLFKSGAKEIGLRQQIMASFMARWNQDLPGCSGHIHISLCQDEKNLFYDESDQHNMSPLMKRFLAGLIRYTPEFLVLMAPTVNSYKRLVKGYWAPTAATWGIDNRTCAFRVIPWGASSTRIEARVPGADMNPYLALSAVLACGLLGIEKNLELNQAAIQGNAYDDQQAPSFAGNLYEASKIFSQSAAAKEVLGEAFVTHFSETRLWEWEQSQKAVTDWELQRYFEII
ncbi:MAG: glutamine synthetase family protein [Oligoflexus sp.]